MSTMERLFLEIFDRKRRTERQLHEQFESYGESLACNVIADGGRPPPWLLKLAPATEICVNPLACRHPSSSFWNTKRKSCSPTQKFIQGTLPRDDSDFKSSLHDFVIAPTLNQRNKIPHIAEEIHCACSREVVRSTNLFAFESEIHQISQGAEKLQSYVGNYENKNSASFDRHDGPEKGEEPSEALQCLYGCDIIGMSDTAGVMSSYHETMTDLKESNTDLPHVAEDNIFCKADNIPSLEKKRASTASHLVDEFLIVPSMDDIRFGNVMPFESQIDHTSHGAEKFSSNVDSFENKAFESLVQYGVSEEGEPYNVKQYFHRGDITGTSDTVGVKSSDGNVPDFKGSSISLSCTLEANISKDADQPNLPKERASATPHLVEEIINVCSRDEVRTSKFMPCDSGFHHTFQCGVDSFENKASESLCHHEGSEEGEEPNDAKDRRVVTSISDTSGVESRCDENMPEFEGFDIDLPYEEDNIVFNDADIPSLAKERAFALEQLRQSSILLTRRPKSSIMNRMDMISDVSNSSPLGILQKMDLDFSLEHNNPVIEQFTSTSSIKPMGMFCNNGPQLDGPVFESSHSLSSLSARFGSELQSLPLTPPAIKFSHVRLSGKKSSSSLNVSSNPELVCFRIDENSSTTEENADVVQVGYSTQRPSSRNIEVLTNSKPLSDVTSLYQNGTCLLSNSKEFLVRDSLESVNSDAASSLGFEYPEREYNLKNKENHRYTDAIKELGKSTKTVTKRSERPRISCRYSDRIRKNQNILKGCKQSNISSFIPQIQQKQRQALPLQKKKDIKVKALKAAEAAKRLEDQMKLEREKRKAAVKLKREKLRQENTKRLKFEQKQKAEEGRKKENIAARKRHREVEERKVKDRKRQCIGETRTLQRQHRDKLHCGKAEKDNQQKTIDEDQKGGKQRNNGGQKKLESVVDVMESQMAVEMQQCTIELVSADTIRGDDKIKVLVASAEHTSFEKGVGSSNFLQETVEDTVCAAHISFELQSYEMSPYQTSDEEDMEEDSRHRKYIPKWARGESLVESIVSNQQLDPKDIFSRKRSFSISQVLAEKKKDIKVKALEVAEAAKRLEDQMKLEREKRKAAVKLEREKLRQENTKRLKFEQKQKAEEGRKKENIAARKRHRETEERKVKDRKRQCIGETRTLQRQHRDKSHCGKAEKDNRQKTIDEEQKGGKQRNNGGQKKLESAVDVMESQMAVEMQQCTIELVSADTRRGDDKIKALVASDERTSFEKGVGGSIFLRETVEETVCAAQISFELQSYEMSPYQTSDEEDMEEDSRHRKYIPKWAR